MTNPSGRDKVRFVIVACLLTSTAVFLHSRTRAEVVPPRASLLSFPIRIGNWAGRDLLISDETRKILGGGEFLHRIYWRSQDEPYIEFFLAYFPTQRSGSTIHSPKNCLPGAGWVPVDSGHMAIRRPDGQTAGVNRFIIAKGADREMVLYWYQSHGRVVASEYWSKLYLVGDAIRLNRSDGALVRIITPMARQEDPESSQQRAVGFASQVLSLLDSYIPR